MDSDLLYDLLEKAILGGNTEAIICIHKASELSNDRFIDFYMNHIKFLPKEAGLTDIQKKALEKAQELFKF